MAKVVLEGGTDIDCGGALTSALPAALSSGYVSRSELDPALTNLFTVRMRLGEFDPAGDQPYRAIPTSAVS